MKCCICAAQSEKGKRCKAGIIPYTLKNGEEGCCCNRLQVEKYMMDEARRENHPKEDKHARICENLLLR